MKKLIDDQNWTPVSDEQLLQAQELAISWLNKAGEGGIPFGILGLAGIMTAVAVYKGIFEPLGATPTHLSSDMEATWRLLDVHKIPISAGIPVKGNGISH